MDEHKIPQEDPEHREEPVEYSFLQEVIKDEAGSRKKLKGILRMMGYGLVFGVVASFTFSALKPWFDSKFSNNPQQVTIPDETEEEELKEEWQEQAQNQPMDTESYRQMLQSLSAVAEKTNKSMVEVTGLTGEEDWTKESDRNKQSVSGLIVADNGQELLILGKLLPVKNAKSIQITFVNGDRYNATEKKRDNNLGICIYAVTRSEIESSTWAKTKTAVLGSSNSVAMGDTAIVLGKPFGYANAVGYGVVASDESYKESADGDYKLICTDVAGAGEGSGIIANIKGEVIGIIDQTATGEDSANLITGYGISDIKDVIELLSNGMGVPYVGICGMDVTEDMVEQGLSKGVYVKEVEADSPAMAAGIQSGDIITNMDDTDVASLGVYHSMLMKKSEGSEIKLKGCRQGAGGEYVDIDFSVTVGTKQ